MKKIYFSIIGLSALLLASCGQNRTQENSEEQVEEVHEHSSLITLTERQMQAVNIRLGDIEQRDLNHVVRVNGELTLSPQKKASVNPLTGGIIRQILVYEGTSVNAGQTLAYIENPEIVEMQKNYLVAKQEASIAEQNLKRQNELSSQGAGVEKTLQQATASCEIAKAQLAGLEKQLQQLSVNPKQVTPNDMVTQIPVKAPIAGTIDKIFVNIGSYVDIQHPLMTLSDNSQLHCDIRVFEKDVNLIKNGQEVDLTLTNQKNTRLKGVVYGVNHFFENDAKAITVHVRIAGTKHALPLLPGMYVTGLVNVGKHKTEAVPDEAIVSSDGKKYIFLLEDEISSDDGKMFRFRRIEVVTGINELGFTQITPLEKLNEKVKIAASNAFYIASMLAGEEEED